VKRKKNIGFYKTRGYRGWTFKFAIHMSVRRNVNPNYNQRDATFLDLFTSTDTLHVSDGSSAHHQEHITVHTASGILSLWFRASQFYTTIIQQDAAMSSQFYFTAALLYMFRGAFHAHHQECINCIYSLRYRSYIGAATFLQRGRV